MHKLPFENERHLSTKCKTSTYFYSVKKWPLSSGLEHFDIQVLDFEWLQFTNHLTYGKLWNVNEKILSISFICYLVVHLETNTLAMATSQRLTTRQYPLVIILFRIQQITRRTETPPLIRLMVKSQHFVIELVTRPGY